MHMIFKAINILIYFFLQYKMLIFNFEILKIKK
jgi:hypothetical protein